MLLHLDPEIVDGRIVAVVAHATHRAAHILVNYEACIVLQNLGRSIVMCARRLERLPNEPQHKQQHQHEQTDDHAWPGHARLRAIRQKRNSHRDSIA